MGARVGRVGLWAWSGTLALGALGVACGGDDPPADPGGENGGSSASGGASTGGSAGSSVSGGATSGTGGAPTGGSGGAGTSGKGGGTTGGSSGAGNAAGTGDRGGTGGSSSTPGLIDCSEANQPLTCAPGTKCCGVNGADNYCAADCGTDPALPCDGPEDCDGKLCCFADHDTGTFCATGDTCEPMGVPMCESQSDCPAALYLCCTRTSLFGTVISLCASTISSCS